MKKYSILILVVTFTLGCSKFGVNFKVKNNSSYVIDSLSISNGFNLINMYELKNDNLHDSFLSFKTNYNEKISDGGYTMTIYSNNEKKTSNFGYYSNGIPLDIYYKINIENDTILITEHRNKKN